MIRRRLWISLLGIVIVAALLLGINLIARNEPVLGLDLQGGVSVVLATDEEASASDLTFIRDLIRDELESRGIAEPDVRVEGENIVVDLPGVKDQRQALDAVDVAGIVTLRPVMSQCAPPLDESATESTVPTSTDVSATTTAEADDSGTATTSADGTAAVETSNGDTTEAAGFRRPASADTTEPDTSEPSEASEPSETSEPTESTVEETTTTTTTIPLGPLGVNPLDTIPPSPYAPAPPSSEESTVELPTRDGFVCVVGPVPVDILGGPAVFAQNSAKAVLDNTGGWQVTVGLSSTGSGSFNSLASSCFNDPQQGGQTCPTGQLAIVMDDEIITHPTVNAASFPGEVSITGNFSESEARELARVLDRGAFPVQVHAETVQTVSATLGEDSMRAAVFAGLAGVTLVLLLLAYFYRRLILVVIAGVAVWGMLIYSASTFISESTNYALTLAGVTGIIVAIGVTVDTYVVYFERMKEEVRHGRTIRNSALRSFKATWRTIVAADFVALIAAVVLFVLSVGSVRGFALYLGVTTVCDLVVCFFFTRPAVGLLADSGWLDRGDTFGLKEYE